MTVAFDTLRAARRLRDEGGFDEKQAGILVDTFAESMGDAAGLAANEDADPNARLESEAGYGFGGPAVPGVVTPYAGLGLAEAGDRIWRAGARWKVAPDATLSLEGARREAANDDAPEHGLMLRGSLRW